MAFLELLWSILLVFVLVAYLMVMFAVISDLFRDDSTSGGVKALWILGLVFLPVLVSLIYLLARGDGMAARQSALVRQAKDAQEAYIRDVASVSPAQQIEDARRLLETGAVTQPEFEVLKSKALA